ncbi:hypothetical protein B0H17DRAFT_1031639 [Mycena rosella]|uniref:Uncharacterized protein n=1 Tax=Mycena rosella TaxID=1033263 RepID=A0AAD7GYL6_MYCRO|nr:hypothetical protein B0H17DRAFT_1031639 [Mycena rosella]
MPTSKVVVIGASGVGKTSLRQTRSTPGLRPLPRPPPSPPPYKSGTPPARSASPLWRPRSSAARTPRCSCTTSRARRRSPR